MAEDARLELPTLPAPRARALQLLTGEGGELRDIAETIESDPALTLAVLRAANSAASASRVHIQSAHDAVVRIGLGSTRRIVAGAVLGNAFHDLERAQLDVDAMWRYLVATALLADAASSSDRGPGAFTAGLLHDVGRLAMAAADPDRYANAVLQARAGLDILEVERDLFGSDHTTFGYRLADDWLLPNEVTEVVLDHHVGTASKLSAAVFQARRVARSLGLGNGIESLADARLDPDSEDAELVRRLHGPRALLARIEWYRGAMQPGASAAAA